MGHEPHIKWSLEAAQVSNPSQMFLLVSFWRLVIRSVRAEHVGLRIPQRGTWGRADVNGDKCGTEASKPAYNIKNVWNLCNSPTAS